MQQYLDNKQRQSFLFTNNLIISQNTIKLPFSSHSDTVFVHSLLLYKSTNTWKFVHKSEADHYCPKSIFHSKIKTGNIWRNYGLWQVAVRCFWFLYVCYYFLPGSG